MVIVQLMSKLQQTAEGPILTTKSSQSQDHGGPKTTIGIMPTYLFLCLVQHTSINIWLPWLHPTIDRVMPLTVMRDGRKLLLYVYHSINLYTTTTSTLQVYDPLTGKCTHHLKIASNLLGHAVPCDLHLENFVSPKISLMAMPSVCLVLDFATGYTCWILFLAFASEFLLTK